MLSQMVDVDVENEDFTLPADFDDALRALHTYAAASKVYATWLTPFVGGIAGVSPPAPMGQVRADMYTEAALGNYLLELLGAALIEVPNNRKLQELAERVPLRALPPVGGEVKYRRRRRILQEAHERNQVAGTQRLLSAVLGNEDASQGTDDGFERLFPDSPYQNPTEWEKRKRQIERRVCRIVSTNAAGSTDAIGTGFLIGPDLVLTNFHNVADPATSVFHPDFPTLYRCQFDYQSPQNNGSLVALAPDNPLVKSSPAKAPPNADALDFALLRLAASPGDDMDVTTGEKRGYEPLNDLAQPGSNTVVVVFQHPGGQALRFAAGPLIAANGSYYLTHRASTQKGSSGAPCFDFSLRLLGLHHRGPDTDDNVAVRLSAIVPHI